MKEEGEREKARDRERESEHLENRGPYHLQTRIEFSFIETGAAVHAVTAATAAHDPAAAVVTAAVTAAVTAVVADLHL